MNESSRVIGLRKVAELDVARLDLVSGAGCSTALVAQALRQRPDRPLVVIVVPSFRDLEKTLDDVSAFCPDAAIFELPTPETSPYEPVRADRMVTLKRASVLTELSLGKVEILVMTSHGWARKGAPPHALAAGARTLSRGERIDLVRLAEHLERIGYTRVALVEDPGSFSARGDLFDVWPPSLEDPVRLSMKFDQVESLTVFDPQSQIRRPESSLSSVLLTPAREAIITEETSARAERIMQTLCDAEQIPSSRAQGLIKDVASGRLFLGGAAYLPALYDLKPVATSLPQGTVVLFEDPERCVEAIHTRAERTEREYAERAGEARFPLDAHYLSLEELDQSLEGKRIYCLHRTGTRTTSVRGFASLVGSLEPARFLETEAPTSLTAELTQARATDAAPLLPLIEHLKTWHERGFRVVLSARTSVRAQHLAELLRHRGLSPKSSVFSAQPEASLSACVSPLARGAVCSVEGIVFLTDDELFGKRTAKKRSQTQVLKDALDDLRSLSVGDYVVHSEHGIARYLGLVHQDLGDHAVDLLHLEYAGGDKLLLPVYRLNQIQKFSAEGVPRLDRLGSGGFSRAKKTVKKKVREMADQLLRLFAERKNATKIPIKIPEEEFSAFEAQFPFEETEDQAAAIFDVVSDLQQPSVMDRLVCGDVGFGKTEVALRAAYLCAYEGRQVALLCPTTILAEQHRDTFSRRFFETGLEVRGLSRFVSKKQQTETLLGLKNGSVDIVIGTHRLLSKDVHFKNLGLLIVDEEQRFGVAHKERLKELKKSVDALTLTATPIPRTLSMAVGGLRDMSLISTPPEGRRSIRTLVSYFDENLVRSAILRELSRGGQIFYVYNRVDGIYERAQLLRRLVPEARVAVGHGQMSEAELERTMLGFVKGDFDVLCATSIIESGLDIPRANTIIVDRADLFGLSQLYQIRGRVGRSKERAYCHLLLPADARLSDEARSRIETLERYSDIGSGFHVAKMDLELRGAGEFLGADQSGFISRVGYEIFLDLLEEATAELSGHAPLPTIDPEISVDVEALLPDFYISEIGVRLSLYKRYAQAQEKSDVAILDEELEDRFGPLPPEAKRFSEVMQLKTELRKLRAFGLSATGSSATLHLSSDTPLSTSSLFAQVGKSGGLYALTPDGRLKRTPKTHEKNGLVHASVLLSEVSTWAEEGEVN